MLQRMFALFFLINFNVLATASFERGDHYIHTILRGFVSVSCTSSPFPVTYRCSLHELYPSIRSRLISDKINADRVKFKVTHEDSSVQLRSGKMKNGASRNIFTLWSNSIFSQSLLGEGNNLVEYSLWNKGNSLESGDFNVFVEDGGFKDCREIRLFGEQYCNRASACLEYFVRTTCR